MSADSLLLQDEKGTLRILVRAEQTTPSHSRSVWVELNAGDLEAIGPDITPARLEAQASLILNNLAIDYPEYGASFPPADSARAEGTRQSAQESP